MISGPLYRDNPHGSGQAHVHSQACTNMFILGTETSISPCLHHHDRAIQQNCGLGLGRLTFQYSFLVFDPGLVIKSSNRRVGACYVLE